MHIQMNVPASAIEAAAVCLGRAFGLEPNEYYGSSFEVGAFYLHPSSDYHPVTKHVSFRFPGPADAVERCRAAGFHTSPVRVQLPGEGSEPGVVLEPWGDEPLIMVTVPAHLAADAGACLAAVLDEPVIECGGGYRVGDFLIYAETGYRRQTEGLVISPGTDEFAAQRVADAGFHVLPFNARVPLPWDPKRGEPGVMIGLSSGQVRS